MKRFVLSCACALFFGQLSGLAATTHPAGPSQRFHYPPQWSHTADHDRVQKPGKTHASSSKNATLKSQPAASPARQPRRFTASAPTGKLGLLAAEQVPAGGALYNGTVYLEGDFNGDGKPDLAALVRNDPSSFAYSISIMLGNGDGTFQTPVLTPTPGNDSCAEILAGDLNGDGKDDLIVVHQATCSTGSIDVLLSRGDGTFTVGNNYPISDNMFLGGILADVNSDGKLDFVVVDDAEPGKVWTLLGNGNGTFQTPTSVTLSGPAGNGALFVDLNGDGLLDIAYMDSDSNQLDVYLATSPTAYGSSVSYNTPNSVYDACSLAEGDLNGNGKPDLVNTNCGDGTLTVYVNNGDGTFQTGVYYDAATGIANGEMNPGAASIADVNGDGKPDIICTNMNSSDVTILLGNGDGTVNVPSIGYAVGGYAGNPAIIADFNGDGFPDLVVADYDFSLVFLKGYGDGTFRAAIDYYAPPAGNPSGVTIATGDFNGDGNPDFVMGNCCANDAGVTVFLSNPDGTMQPGVDYFSDNTPQDLQYVAVGDFNKDGNLDIVAVDSDNNFAQIFYGVGDGTFTVGPSMTSGESEDQARGVVVGDFNHDGFPDFAVANVNDGTQDVAILLNDGTGNFASVVTYALSNGFNDVGMAVADVNKDGNPDLIIPTRFGNEVAILLGNANGTFQAETDLALPSIGPIGVAVADFNGDGNPDLAMTALNSGTPGQGMYVALGNGNGTFQSPVFYQTTLQDQSLNLPYPQYIQAIDMDGDGKLDLVYTNSNYGTVGILFGNGDGTFDTPLEFPAGQYAYGLAIVDVNHDGTPDVVAAGDDFAGISVLLNLNGSGTQSNYGVTTSTPSATISAGGDAVFNLTITPANHYNGTVTMSCGTLPAYTTCSFNPPSFLMDGHTPVAVQLTVSTTAIAASLREPVAPPHQNPPVLLAGLGGLALVGMVFGGFRKNSRILGVLLAVLAVPAVISLSSCGKDCDDNPGQCATTPTPAAAATTASVTSSLNPAIAGQAVTFTGTVASSGGKPTGSVKFLDGTTQIGTGTLSSGSATFQTSSLTAGTHSITVSYAGDSSFKASTSSALTETVDHPGTPAGTYTIPINATGTAGTNSGSTALHSLSVSITVK